MWWALACGGRYGRYSGYSSYGSYPPPSYSSSGSSGGGSSSSGRPSWSRAGSSLSHTPAEVRALTPVRRSVENRAPLPDLRYVFLFHAWDDRHGAAKELHDLLESLGVSVWFSEKDVGLGTPLLRAIDKGLAKSRVGIVLVTPALLPAPIGEESGRRCVQPDHDVQVERRRSPGLAR